MNTKPQLPPDEADDKAAVLRPALVLFAVLTLVTGLLYPLLVTGVAQTVFPNQANGSLMESHGQVVGSELIGQSFSQPENFWSRPSATGPMAYNAGASSGSNLGPTSPALAEAVQARIEAMRAADPGNMAPVPVDLVTASASGLDPHISLAAARYQVARVARVRSLSPEAVNALVDQHTENTLFGFLGEPRVNVMKLNLSLAAQAATRATL